MVSWLDGPGPVIALVVGAHVAAFVAWAWFSRKREKAEQVDQRLFELADRLDVLSGDLKSDNVRTVRKAAQETKALVGRVLDSDLGAKNTMALVMLDHVCRQKDRAVQRLKEDPVWKLLDAVEGEPRR